MLEVLVVSNSVNVICIKAKSLNQAFEEAKNVFEGFEGVEDCVDPMKVFEKSVKLAGDGSYLAFDTNPANVQHQRKYSKLLAQIDELESTYVYTSIVTTLKSLGFTESTLNKIKNTTALQGVQSDDSKYYRASWTFHPTNGLEITFEFHK